MQSAVCTSSSCSKKIDRGTAAFMVSLIPGVNE
jgi:hypothetical protein